MGATILDIGLGKGFVNLELMSWRGVGDLLCICDDNNSDMPLPLAARGDRD